MVIFASALPFIAINEPFHEWKFKSKWFTFYDAQEKIGQQLIDESNNCLYEDQLMKLFMKTYLVYRIELKDGKKIPKKMKAAFHEVDNFVECMRWCD
jgi:hypothetical protein